MSLLPIEGHEAPRAALARALRRDRLPGSILLYGPAGSGRQRLALWLAQLMLCERSGDEPCGACSACRLALRLEHPDLHWFFPVPRPRGGLSGERLVEAFEAARADALEAKRAQPLQATGGGDAVGLYVGQIHAIRRHASTRPAMATSQVFIIGNAELLVPQESSPEAANALLKLLEEPPTNTTFVLTAPDPDALLPTVRSRLMAVRLRALPEDSVAGYMATHIGIEADVALRAARLGQGTIGRALGFLDDDGAAGPLEETRQRARALLAAAADPDPTARLAAALEAAVSGARGGFRDALDMLGLWLRDLAAVASGEEDVVVNRDEMDLLRRIAELHPRAARGVPDAIERVEEVRAMTANNVNPQLALAWLLREVGAALAGDSPASSETRASAGDPRRALRLAMGGATE